MITKVLLGLHEHALGWLADEQRRLSNPLRWTVFFHHGCETIPLGLAQRCRHHGPFASAPEGEGCRSGCEDKERRGPQQGCPRAEGRFQQDEVSVPLNQEVADLIIAVARLESLANQQPEISRETRV